MKEKSEYNISVARVTYLTVIILSVVFIPYLLGMIQMGDILSSIPPYFRGLIYLISGVVLLSLLVKMHDKKLK